MIIKVVKIEPSGNWETVEYKNVMKIMPLHGGEDLPATYDEGFPALAVFFHIDKETITKEYTPSIIVPLSRVINIQEE